MELLFLSAASIIIVSFEFAACDPWSGCRTRFFVCAHSRLALVVPHFHHSPRGGTPGNTAVVNAQLSSVWVIVDDLPFAAASLRFCRRVGSTTTLKLRDRVG